MEKKIAGLVLTTVLVLCASVSSFSQGRSKGHNTKSHHDHNKYEQHDRSHHKNSRYHDYDHQHDNNRRHREVYVRRTVHPAPWIPGPKYRRPANKRYVYFKDYNVYYDYSRHMYVSLSGGHWVFTADMPLPMRRANVRRIVYTDVNYCGNDIVYYHTHRPGVYASVSIIR